jgi:hypothetical protein
MRLIDADEVINILKETGIIQDNDLGQCVIDEINRIPTAYDVDKVVKELEELPQCSTWNHNSNNIDRIKAINIVKAGGTND